MRNIRRCFRLSVPLASAFALLIVGIMLFATGVMFLQIVGTVLLLSSLVFPVVCDRRSRGNRLKQKHVYTKEK